MHEPVLITETEFRKGETVFSAGEDLRIRRRPAGRAVGGRRAAHARAVVVGSQPYRGPLYEALAANRGEGPALVVRFGVGHDNLDKPQARRYGILVSNTPGTLDASVGGDIPCGSSAAFRLRRGGAPRRRVSPRRL